MGDGGAVTITAPIVVVVDGVFLLASLSLSLGDNTEADCANEEDEKEGFQFTGLEQREQMAVFVVADNVMVAPLLLLLPPGQLTISNG